MERRYYTDLIAYIDISPRTASYLMAIVIKLDNLMINVPMGMGWRKLGEVASLITYENHKVIFAKIVKYTREELIEMRRNKTLTKKGD